jgi:hypothetical protein
MFSNEDEIEIFLVSFFRVIGAFCRMGSDAVFAIIFTFLEIF